MDYRKDADHRYFELKMNGAKVHLFTKRTINIRLGSARGSARWCQVSENVWKRISTVSNMFYEFQYNFVKFADDT